MNKEVLTQLITSHEGKRYKVYSDTEGILTIGIGMNLEEMSAKTRIDALGIDYSQLCSGECELNDTQVSTLFTQDLNDAITDAASIVNNFWELPDNAQHVVIDMIFNMGGPGFSKFKKMIEFLESEPPDFRNAAVEMLDSKWATQVPNRAEEDKNLMLSCAE